MPNFDVSYNGKYAFIDTADKVFSPHSRVMKNGYYRSDMSYFVTRVASILLDLYELGVRNVCLRWGMHDDGNRVFNEPMYGQSYSEALDHLGFLWVGEYTILSEEINPRDIIHRSNCTNSYLGSVGWPAEEDQVMNLVTPEDILALIPNSLMRRWMNRANV